MNKEKIGMYVPKVAIGLIAVFVVITFIQGLTPRKELSEGPLGIENLGTGYPLAKATVEAKCGEDIQFLEYRVGGYLPDSNDTQYSEDGYVQYTFTQGRCVPKEVGPYIPTYAIIEVTIDTKRNALVNDVHIHPLGGGTLSHIGEEEISGIRLSATEVVQITGLPAVNLYKVDGKVIWRARSTSGADVHEVTINALTGKIQKDRKFTQRVD